MRKLSIILLLVVFSTFARAQQLAQFSQYLDNFYLINPAATDVQNNLNLGFGYRQQWGSLPGHPRTFYVTAYAPLSRPDEAQFMQGAMRLSDKTRARSRRYSRNLSPNHILGTVVTSDNIGIFNKTTAHFTYSLHIPLTSNLAISAAPKVGMVNLRLNDELWVLDENDQPFNDFVQQFQSETMLDVGFGLWLYSDRLFMGYSLEQLSKNGFTKLDESVGFEFKAHHFMIAGYRFSANSDISVVPNIMVRYLPSSPVSIDYSLRLEYMSRVWAGFSLRKSQAFVMSFGMFVNNNVRFNYSYDHGMAKGGRDGLSAHEVSLRMSLFPNLHAR